MSGSFFNEPDDHPTCRQPRGTSEPHSHHVLIVFSQNRWPVDPLVVRPVAPARASPSRLDFLATEALRWERSDSFFRTLCHERLCKLCQSMPKAPLPLQPTSPHSLASYCIQRRCAQFNRGDNGYFSCFAQYLFYDAYSTSRTSRKRTTLGWKTRPTSPPLLTLPEFRLLL